jgi:GxxExxY protein
MIIELKHCGHSVSVQSPFPVSYRGELIGNLVPDLIVDDAVIVDPKVVSCFTDTHVAQMIGYLNIPRSDLALLINFNNARLEWKRVLRPQEPDGYDNPDLHASAFLILAFRVIRGFSSLTLAGRAARHGDVCFSDKTARVRS